MNATSARLTEKQLLDMVEEMVGSQYHPLISKARNAIALQKVADDMVRRTIKGTSDNPIIVKHQVALMTATVNNANNAMEALVKHLVKAGGDPLGDLLNALHGAADSTPPPEKKKADKKEARH